MKNLLNCTDEQLYALIKKNDEKAIAALLNRYKNKFYTAIFLYTKDKYLSEDIFQDVCIKIIQNIRLGKYSEDGKFLPWAMRIARNLTIDHLRVKKRTPKITLPDGNSIFNILDFKERNIEDTIIYNQTINKVKSMLLLLPYEQREVIVLRLYGDLSFKQIAEMTQVSINTALGRMRYGIMGLRKVAEEKGILL